MRKNSKKLITTKDLAKISGIKLSIISKYAEQKLLSFEEQDSKLNRYYDKNKALKYLREIKRLKEEGESIKGIKNYLARLKEKETARYDLPNLFTTKDEDLLRIIKEAQDELREALMKGLTGKKLEEVTKKSNRKLKEYLRKNYYKGKKITKI